MFPAPIWWGCMPMRSLILEARQLPGLPQGENIQRQIHDARRARSSSRPRASGKKDPSLSDPSRSIGRSRKNIEKPSASAGLSSKAKGRVQRNETRRCLLFLCFLFPLWRLQSLRAHLGCQSRIGAWGLKRDGCLKGHASFDLGRRGHVYIYIYVCIHIHTFPETSPVTQVAFVCLITPLSNQQAILG